MTLEDFARAVNDTAGRMEGDGTFGGKVFIAALWRRLKARFPSRFGRVTLAEFKRQLVQANKRGLVELVRADLVAAMDATEVLESETSHLEARWHFVRKPGWAGFF